MSHEALGKSDEYYTPEYIFRALKCEFDMDAASPVDRRFCCVPAKDFITKDSLVSLWQGFIWLNPPFEGRNDKKKWLDKMNKHRNGIVLTPDRSSTDWWQDAALECDLLMQIRGKIKFVNDKGEICKQPANGTTLFGYGPKARMALINAQKSKLGIILKQQP